MCYSGDRLECPIFTVVFIIYMYILILIQKNIENNKTLNIYLAEHCSIEPFKM